MRRIISLVFYAALAMLGVVFTLLNLRSVTINYHIGQVELPLAAVVIISIALGVATGVLVCLGAKFKERMETHGLRKKIAKLEQENQQLRKVSFKGKL